MDLLPTGECWCGCGLEAALGKFFRPGHDSKALHAFLIMRFGKTPIPGFLVDSGYGPRRSLYDEWVGQGGKPYAASLSTATADAGPE